MVVTNMKSVLNKGVVGTIIGLILLIALPALAAAAPDVTVTGVTVWPPQPRVNQPAVVIATVQNVGDATASGTWANFAITAGSITYTSQNATGMALDPNDVRQVSILWTPVTTGTHTLTVTAGNPADANTANDVLSTTANVAATGTIAIRNFFVTPTLLVDGNGCTSLSPLYASGFVTEDGFGTNDRVLVYVDNVLKDSVRASALQGGLFQSSMSTLCFDQPGDHTVRADVDRGGSVLATASGTVNALFTLPNGDRTIPRFPNLVDIEGMPRILRLGAGEFSEYVLSIENLGTSTDTYNIKVTSSATVDTWLDLETNIVTVEPGQIKYVSLFADVPRDAPDGSYPVNVIAEGRSTDIDRLYLVTQNQQMPPGTPGVQPDYSVDIELNPVKLDVDAGESGQYVATVKNIGKKTDTYDLTTLVSSKTRSWFRFERDRITLAPGEQQQIKVFVDVPEEAAAKSYPVSVEADGAALDIDRGSLTVIRAASGFDVEVGKTGVSPSTIPSGRGQGIAVKASVSFVDLTRESPGENVLVRLYVDGQSVQRQTVFIPSGESKQVSFTLDSGDSPINAEPGTYHVYMVASVGNEIDRGEGGTLTLVEPGASVITGVGGSGGSTQTTTFNTTANSDVGLTLTVKNADLKDNTYTISAEGSGALNGKVSIEPTELSVPEGEVRSSDFVLKVGNVKDGMYTVTIKAKAGDAVAEKSITVNVKGGQQQETIITTSDRRGNQPEFGPGLISAETGGVLAAIVAAVLISIFVLGYYHTGHPLGLIRKKPEDGGEGAMEEVVQKEQPKPAKAEAPKPKAEKPMVWQGAEPSTTFAKREKPKGEWPAHEAEKVLLNLENIRDQFKKTAEEAGKVKEKLSIVAGETVDTLKEKVAEATENVGFKG